MSPRLRPLVQPNATRQAVRCWTIKLRTTIPLAKCSIRAYPHTVYVHTSLRTPRWALSLRITNGGVQETTIRPQKAKLAHPCFKVGVADSESVSWNTPLPGPGPP